MIDPFHNLQRGHYGAILADPPWGFQTWSGPEKKVASRGTVAPYQTMEMADIAKLPATRFQIPIGGDGIAIYGQPECKRERCYDGTTTLPASQ